jgi:hypothetical protein
MLVGSVVAGLAVSGCGGTEVTTDPTRRDGGNPVERERSPDSGVHLTLIDQQEIATSGLITMRPDVARTARGTYLGVTANAPTPRHAFDVFALDSALSSVRSTKIIASDASGSGEVAITGMPTDLRVASDGADVVWCALETALIASAGSTCKNCLNVAAYRDTSGTLTLAAHQEVECVSVTCPEAGGQLPTFPAGSIMTNDPAPLAYGGKYYVMLHQYGASGLGYAPTPIQVVKVFDASFTEEPSFTLDLGTALGSSSPGTYALVTIQGSPWLIGSAYSGPPCGSCASPPTADGSAYLFAIQLSPDLKATVGSAVTLSQTKTYQHYVTGARYAEGKLYVTHNVEGNAPGSYPKGVLKVFDVSHGFAELEDITINQSVAGMDGVGYNHITVEVIAGKVYAFFPQPTKIPENTVGVKVFEWR